MKLWEEGDWRFWRQLWIFFFFLFHFGCGFQVNWGVSECVGVLNEIYG